jgi:sterol desaturase/sphingolipid hydroxylase (fatty acid hydroxylase superfamily)
VGALSFASIALAAATEVHAFARDQKAPRAVRWLQSRGVLLSPEHHARHHRGAHDRVYGIVNGWSNGVLDRCRIFRFLESVHAREGFATDVAYLFSNQVLTFALVLPASQMVARVRYEPIARAVASQCVVLQVLEIVVAVDLFQYGIHRLFHEVPFLFRIHAIHHSSRRLDWLAGSRLHFVDVLVVRTLTMAPVLVCGFSEIAVRSYAVLAAITGAFLHADIRRRFVALEHIVVTPRYHALHHAADVEGSGKNFAFHLPVIDRIFGTHFLPSHSTPLRFGIRGCHVPDGLLHQLLFPLQRLFRSI